MFQKNSYGKYQTMAILDAKEVICVEKELFPIILSNSNFAKPWVLPPQEQHRI